MKEQKITSANTSVNSVAKTFKTRDFLNYHAACRNRNNAEITRNFDYGAGKYDTASRFLESCGIQNITYDKYNLEEAHNANAWNMAWTVSIDTITINNVFNVIDSDDEIRYIMGVVSGIAARNPHCRVYVKIYEGDKSGRHKATSRGFQRNEIAENYTAFLKAYFWDVKRKGDLFIAENPI